MGAGATQRERHQGTRQQGAPTRGPDSELRIIGGRLRGSHVAYSGDPRTRPMKERVREAVFNLLGPAVRDSYVLDLFAGTGAMALEAISRGAAAAVAFEQHFPSVRLIEENVSQLGASDFVEAVAGDAFFWVPRRLPTRDRRWTVFCCPPYDFYVERPADLLGLLETLVRAAPPASRFVVESDARFDFAQLAPLGEWRVHDYPPARVGILVIAGDTAEGPIARA